jgi:hypothetical protein
VRRRFALDQNFPRPILGVLGQYLIEAELVPLGEIDRGLTRDTEDWEILLALHRHSDHWDGLITTDSGMLLLPKELTVLCQTKLTLVVAEGAGHDPIKASGLVLTHLPNVCNRTDTGRPQLWVLRTTAKPAEDPWTRLSQLAERRGQQVKELYREMKLTDEELA